VEDLTAKNLIEAKPIPAKRHPMFIVCVILVVFALFLAASMALVLSFLGPSDTLSFGDRIGVIPIQGLIMDSDPIVSQLVSFKKDQRIKAIILRIDSPGGGVGPSQEIYREVRKTMQIKKVVVSMGGLAASGGYYVASAANRIVANPGTITGSIGVIMEFIQIEDLLEKLGVGLEVVKSGQFKDIGSPHRRLSPEDRELLKDLIVDIQDQFVQAVARGRDLSSEEVREIADGRILTGSRAKDLGLVDMLGNFQDAVDLAKNLAGIEGDVTLVYPRKGRAKFWDLLFEDAMKSLYRAALDRLTTRVEYRWIGLPGS
jgi:protease-4